MPTSKTVASRLVDECVSAKAHYQIWWALGNRALPKYHQTMSEFSHVDFFHAASPGHFTLYLLSIAKIFDRDDRVAGVKALRESLRAEGRGALANRVASELKSQAPLVTRVMRIRNRLLAHNDHSTTADELFRINGVTPNDLRDLIDAVSRILNEVARELGLSERVFDSKRYESATLSMLETLKFGVRARRA